MSMGLHNAELNQLAMSEKAQPLLDAVASLGDQLDEKKTALDGVHKILVEERIVRTDLLR